METSIIPKEVACKLSNFIVYKVYDYITPVRYKFPEWIEKNIEKLDFSVLALNSRNISILSKYQHMLDERAWYNISSLKCEESVKLLSENTDKLNNRCWRKLCTNPNAIEFIRNRLETLTCYNCWEELSKNKNPAVLKIFVENPSKNTLIDWEEMCNNHKIPDILELVERNKETFPSNCWRIVSRYDIFVIPFLEKHEDKARWFDWKSLSANPHALSLLSKHLNFVELSKIASNSNPESVKIIEKWMKINPDKIGYWSVWDIICIHAVHPETFELLEQNFNKLGEGGWYHLSKNPNAIPMLEKHIDKVNWGILSENTGALVRDEKKIRNRINKRMRL